MFSESFLQDPWVILIMLGNYLFLIGLFFVIRHYGRKKYHYDERYYRVNNQAKARAWDIMFIVLLITWPLVIMFDGISFSFFLISILYVVGSLSYVFTSAYYNSKE